MVKKVKFVMPKYVKQNVIYVPEQAIVEAQGTAFDLDGTLIDSTWVWNVAARKTLGKLGIKPHTEIENGKEQPIHEWKQYRKYRKQRAATDNPIPGSRLYKEWAKFILDRYPEIREISDDFKDITGDQFYENAIWPGIADVLSKEVTVKTGALEFLSELKKYGIPRTLVTASTDEVLNEYLKNNSLCALLKNFDQENIISGSKVSKSKPNPEGYLKAAAQMGIDPKEVIAFEDNMGGVKAAQNAGMKIVIAHDNNAVHERDVLHEITPYYAKDFNDIFLEWE